MAFTNHQNAMDVGTLLKWLCGLPRTPGELAPPSRDEALKAALRLNAAAIAKESGGVRASDLIDNFPG